MLPTGGAIKKKKLEIKKFIFSIISSSSSIIIKIMATRDLHGRNFKVCEIIRGARKLTRTLTSIIIIIIIKNVTKALKSLIRLILY